MNRIRVPITTRRLTVAGVALLAAVGAGSLLRGDAEDHVPSAEFRLDPGSANKSETAVFALG